MKMAKEWLQVNEAYLRVNNLLGMDAITLLKELKKRHKGYCIWLVGNCTDIHTLKRAIKIIKINARDDVGNTPLHWACILGRIETARILLEHGAKVNVKNHYGKTPLHFASRYGRIEIAKTLLEHGAKVNIKTNYGETPLHLAIFNGHAELAKTLLNYGADVNAKNTYYKIPLSLANIYIRKEHGDPL